MLIIRDRPTFPPSLISVQEAEPLKFCEMLAAAIKDKSFFVLLVAFTMLDSIFIALGVVIDPFFEALKFSSTEVSILGGAFIIAGVLSSLLFGVLLDKFRKYSLILKIICVGSCVVLSSFYPIMLTGSKLFVFIIAVVFGMILVPFLPVGTAYAGEITFPMQEAVIIGILQMTGQVGGLLFGFIGSVIFSIDAISEYQQTEACLAMFVLLAFIAALCSFFIKEDLKRLMYSRGSSPDLLRESNEYSY
jgi:MFS family permease